MTGWKKYLDDEHGTERLTRVEKMRRGKRSVRGRTVDDWIVNAGLNAAEARDKVHGMLEAGALLGRVCEVHKRHIFVAEEDEDEMPSTNDLWLCTVAKRHFQRAHAERNFVVVGDRVVFVPDQGVELDEEGEPASDLPRGTIQHAFERTSKVSRKDPLRAEWEHVMLANIDTVLVVASVLHPEVRWGLIDRFLVQAELQALPAVIVLNKVDLLQNKDVASPEFIANYKRRVEVLRGAGYEVIEVCALKPKKTPTAIKRLRQIFKGKLVGLCGHSGVGKSSVLNLMQPEFEQVVDENPEIFYKGRHTTTYNSLLKLDIGGYAIDTPGIRSLAVSESDPITLTHCFREFRPFRCRYRACTHEKEPGCGIKGALEEGKIAPERYRSYLGILKGQSWREGEGDDTDSGMIADLKARQQGGSSIEPSATGALSKGDADGES